MADIELETRSSNSMVRLGSTALSTDENMSNTSDLDSDNQDDDEEIPPEKMDPEDREIYDKLKMQEQEERAEIERELKAHKDALARQQEFEELRAKELRMHAERLQQARIERELLQINAARLGSYHLATAVSGPPIFNFRVPVKAEHSPPLALTRDTLKPTDLSNHSNINSIYGGHSSYLERSYPKSLSPPSPTQPGNTNDSNHHWSFQEQFKQLYELSEDGKRREFLDDLFAFMQKREGIAAAGLLIISPPDPAPDMPLTPQSVDSTEGTPVNRIPIMAKQTLDLYELFRLVVSKGGLVEVINKKLWREITKGLNLPSSITSAAFTLRTQYMKYLYPYECDRLKLSTPSELQAAIDGNRREGRRSSFGYDMPSPGPTMIPPAHAVPPNHPMQHHNHPLMHPHHLNGGFMNGKLPFPAGFYNEDPGLPATPTPIRIMSERDAMAMEAASRAMEEATKKMEASSRSSLDGSPPAKRPAYSEEERLLAHAGLPSAHLKITSRNDGRSEIDNSLVISMEINGMMYQGVLFAQHHRRL